ncbi:hypothetical protein ASPSYDRAFT_83889 [Aspergillus sydowii CBS 593.65]|uniref:Uncharacterized protein n=1 Tax=Aspergillus sydowii CBS 593.65 TaxID=1036612 RepID=A0A1L9TWR9_9EURO|nr:uncharacterized protein ASPSYDRAFT_83889 [Aspergillus sydowii CBS 593.65]OJJ63845.1 hypothetical protein ASPSYDRAFT_83889 [Aspergillus sydowii CBS 593.65]
MLHTQQVGDCEVPALWLSTIISRLRRRVRLDSATITIWAASSITAVCFNALDKSSQIAHLVSPRLASFCVARCDNHLLLRLGYQ